LTWQGKNILVTGSSGFIGTHLVNRLILEGSYVIGIDVKPPRNFEIKKTNFKAINFDVSKGIPKISEKLDAIFHLAATAAPNYCISHPNEAFSVNVNGLYNILEFARKNRIPKFIFPSSAQLYGRNPKYLPINEDHPLDSIQNVYTITKKLGEDLCKIFNKNNDMSITILRLFNVFGPLQDLDYFIPTIIKQALENQKIELWSEKPTRDWNYVQNVVDAFLMVGDSLIDGIYNVGSGKETKTSEVAKLVASKYNAQLKFLNKEVSGSLRLQCDFSKINKIFGWSPKIDLKDGVKITLEWYENFFRKK